MAELTKAPTSKRKGQEAPLGLEGRGGGKLDLREDNNNSKCVGHLSTGLLYLLPTASRFKRVLLSPGHKWKKHNRHSERLSNLLKVTQ